MGRDKALIRVEGVPLLELQARRVREAGASTLWVSHAHGSQPAFPTPWDVRWLPDEAPGVGPWPGVMRALRATKADALLVLAVDLPAMTAGFLRRLVERAACGMGCIPRSAGGLEPLCALYPLPSALLAAEAMDPKGEPSPRRLAEEGIRDGWMRSFVVHEADAPFLVNWNHPADWTPADTNPAD